MEITGRRVSVGHQSLSPACRTVPCTCLEPMPPVHLPSLLTGGPGPGSPSQGPGGEHPWEEISGCGEAGGEMQGVGKNIRQKKIIFTESRASQDSAWSMSASQASSLPFGTDAFLFIPPGGRELGNVVN